VRIAVVAVIHNYTAKLADFETMVVSTHNSPPLKIITDSQPPGCRRRTSRGLFYDAVLLSFFVDVSPAWRWLTK
jgi:hypothetical protein